MPKKKIGKPVKKSAAGKAASKATAARKDVAKTKTQASTPAKKKSSAGKFVAKSAPAKRADVKTAVPKSPPVSSKPATTAEVSLGRPLVTQEEKLYMLFHDDYQARQVFEFLRVENVKELEQFSQQQIVHMMSKPLRMTVERIRQRLAQYKRSLKDDEQFAAEYLRHGE